MLMDLSLAMPELNGLAATRLTSASGTRARVVILTASEDDADLFEAIKSGAQRYLIKNVSSAELFRQLDAAAAGEPALTPGLARKLLPEFARPAAKRNPADILTEREVLDLLVQGVTSTRDLAQRLVVTENTVKYQLPKILDKLHVQNPAQVVEYAVRHGMISNS